MRKYMNKKVRVDVFLCGIVTGSLALADCPNTMPSQLLQDCIVYESSGSGPSFPNADYDHMDLYSNWLKEQQPTSNNRPARISSMEKK